MIKINQEIIHNLNKKINKNIIIRNLFKQMLNLIHLIIKILKMYHYNIYLQFNNYWLFHKIKEKISQYKYFNK
jgi:hypothetical protein